MKVEVAVLGSPSLIVLMVSVDVKQHLKKNEEQANLEPRRDQKQGGGAGLS